jgi:hypothetical protein
LIANFNKYAIIDKLVKNNICGVLSKLRIPLYFFRGILIFCPKKSFGGVFVSSGMIVRALKEDDRIMVQIPDKA